MTRVRSKRYKVADPRLLIYIAFHSKSSTVGRTPQVAKKDQDTQVRVVGVSMNE